MSPTNLIKGKFRFEETGHPAIFFEDNAVGHLKSKIFLLIKNMLAWLAGPLIHKFN